MASEWGRGLRLIPASICQQMPARSAGLSRRGSIARGYRDNDGGDGGIDVPSAHLKFRPLPGPHGRPAPRPRVAAVYISPPVTIRALIARC